MYNHKSGNNRRIPEIKRVYFWFCLFLSYFFPLKMENRKWKMENRIISRQGNNFYISFSFSFTITVSLFLISFLINLSFSFILLFFFWFTFWFIVWICFPIAVFDLSPWCNFQVHLSVFFYQFTFLFSVLRFARLVLFLFLAYSPSLSTVTMQDGKRKIRPYLHY